MAIAVDGKEMRGAKNRKGSRVYPLTAIDQDTHAVLGQVVVDENSNEIPQFPVALGTLHVAIRGAVTADAMHTQTGHARYLAERVTRYILTVKVNQPILLEQLSTVPWSRVPDGDKKLGESKRAADHPHHQMRGS